MTKRLADALGLAADRVSVKARPRGLGLLGRRDGIAAMAVASVRSPREDL